MSKLPSIEYLRKALSLNPITGEMRWNYREDMPGNWNTRYAGMIALSADKGQGYRSSTVNGKRLLAHRVVWALYYGEWPVGEIDHINGIGSDNRVVNLRLASRSQNCSNIKGRRGGARCFKGVFWHAPYNQWVAKICVQRKNVFIGYFADDCEAARAYDKVAAELFGDFAKTNQSMGLFEDPNRVLPPNYRGSKGVPFVGPVTDLDDLL